MLTFVEVERDGMAGVDGIAGAFSVTVSGDGKNVYVAGSADDAVALFTRNAGSGTLTFVALVRDEVGPVKGLAGAASVAVSPDGANLYAAGPGDSAVPVFTRNPSNGLLTYREREKEGLGAADGLAGVEAVATSPDGLHLYAAGAVDGALAVLARDPALGTLDFVEAEKDGLGGVDGLAGATGVAVSADGEHVYAVGATDSALVAFARDPVTGEVAFVEAELDGVGGVEGLGGASSVAVSPDGGHVYATGAADDAVAVFDRNAGTGALTFVEVERDGVGGVEGLAGASGVAVSPDGAHVYVTGAGESAGAAFGRDPGTGALSFVEVERDGFGGVAGLAAASGVAVSADGKHVYVTGAADAAVAVFDRDPGTGALAFVEVQEEGTGGVQGLGGASGVVVSPDGGAVYTTGAIDEAVAVFGRDPLTGSLAYVEAQQDNVAGVDGLAGAAGAAVTPDSRHLYAAGPLDQAVAIFRVIVCGDGIVDASEECDDANSASGDCCSSSCLLEAAASPCLDDGDPCTADTCDGAGTCVHPDNGICPRCGNGILTANEDCDDGNTAGGDCCAASCRFEPAGSPCAADASACTADACDGGGTCL
ncbi:MAG: beta-propeller fold lactonase family protein, partial [bacterium]